VEGEEEQAWEVASASGTMALEAEKAWEVEEAAEVEGAEKAWEVEVAVGVERAWGARNRWDSCSSMGSGSGN